MNKKIIFPVVTIGIVAIAVIIVFNKTSQTPGNSNATSGTQDNNAEVVPAAPENKEAVIKEFSMTSFVEMVNSEPKPQFSLKEITVNQSDKVRIKITVTAGTHDFKIDEYNVYADTQLSQEYVVEFVADKAGEFIYYCTKPGHKQNGHWGVLRVLD